MKIFLPSLFSCETTLFTRTTENLPEEGELSAGEANEARIYFVIGQAFSDTTVVKNCSKSMGELTRTRLTSIREHEQNFSGNKGSKDYF